MECAVESGDWRVESGVCSVEGGEWAWSGEEWSGCKSPSHQSMVQTKLKSDCDRTIKEQSNKQPGNVRANKQVTANKSVCWRGKTNMFKAKARPTREKPSNIPPSIATATHPQPVNKAPYMSTFSARRCLLQLNILGQPGPPQQRILTIPPTGQL